MSNPKTPRLPSLPGYVRGTGIEAATRWKTDAGSIVTARTSVLFLWQLETGACENCTPAANVLMLNMNDPTIGFLAWDCEDGDDQG